MVLITDRTESDALMKNEKGVYSYSDLNRVESAVEQIAERLPLLGIGVQLETKTDWGLPGNFSSGTWPTASQMGRYLGNIAAIRDVLFIPIAIPAFMEKLTWEGANNIEKVLQSANTTISGILQTYKYSGEFYAGEEI